MPNLYVHTGMDHRFCRLTCTYKVNPDLKLSLYNLQFDSYLPLDYVIWQQSPYVINISCINDIFVLIVKLHNYYGFCI